MADQLPNLEGDGGRGIEATPVVIVSTVLAALTLLTAASATGAGVAWPGGAGVMFVGGTFGGATAALQWSDDGSTWWALGAGYSLTAAGLIQFNLPSGQIRASITGGSGVSLNATAKHV
jgi:hypothetical protein